MLLECLQLWFFYLDVNMNSDSELYNCYILYIYYTEV